MNFLRLAAVRCYPRLTVARRFASDQKQVFPLLSHDFVPKPKGKFEGRSDRLGVPDDYPDPPFISYQLRPAHGWMDDMGRRNLNTPMHQEDDLLSMWLWDPPPPRYTPFQQAMQLLGMLGRPVSDKYVMHSFVSVCAVSLTQQSTD